MIEQLTAGTGITVLRSYNLLDYAACMSALYHDLDTWLKQRFGSEPICFQPHERLLFWHTDLDFYYSHEQPGFTLHNLQVILQTLDISNFFCVIVSHTQNYEKFTRMAQDQLTNDDFSIRAVTSLQEPCEWMRSVVADNHLTQVVSPWIIPCRRQRFHRTFFMAKLFDRDLQNQGLIAYNNVVDQIPPPSAKQSMQTCPCQLIVPVPFNLDHHVKVLKDPNNRRLVAQFQSTVVQFRNFDESVDVENFKDTGPRPMDIIQQALVYVGIETVAHYPEPFVSAISFRGAANRRAWILFGAPGILRFMRDMGFMTFGDFWDESYDLIQDWEQRTQAIIDILYDLAQLDQSQLNSMLQDMRPILDHNFEHFSKRFSEQEQKKITQALEGS